MNYGIIDIMCTPTTEKLGATPANIQWNVVRGDTATLKVEFFEDDEVTLYDTSGWTFEATSYDPLSDVLDLLTIESYEDGVIYIIAKGEITKNWGGTKYKPVVAELRFDLQATIPGDGVSGGGGDEVTQWTPVVGTICVIGDVSGTL
jgi:hypothetical protein